MIRHIPKISVVTAIFVLTPLKLVAQPAPLFEQHLEEILSQAPANITLRLPPEILLNAPNDLAPNALNVRIITSRNPVITTINLMSCESGIFPCLIGSIVLESSTSTNAQRELQRHQAAAAPITLDTGVTGHLLDGRLQQPAYDFSSVMWRQNNTIYTLSFPAEERQNMLYMALQMARSNPISAYSVGVPASFPQEDSSL